MREIQVAISSRCKQNKRSGHISHMHSHTVTAVIFLLFSCHSMDTDLIERKEEKKVNHGDLVNLLFTCFDCLITVILLISIVACNEKSAVSFVGKVKRVSHSISRLSPTPFDVRCITNCHPALLFAADATAR